MVHEAAATPVLWIVLGGLFLGLGLAGFVAWVTERPWGIGLLTVLVGFAPLLWALSRSGGEAGAEAGAEAAPGAEPAAAAGHSVGPSLSNDDLALLGAGLVGLVLGLLMIRAVDRSVRRALAEGADGEAVLAEQRSAARRPAAPAHGTSAPVSGGTTVVTTTQPRA